MNGRAMNKRIADCRIHETAMVMDFVNLYSCEIGPEAFIGPFVEIQKEAKVGEKSRISSHSFVCQGVTIGKNCFIGHGVMFTNDKYDSPFPNQGDAVLRPTRVGDHVRIGSNATILPVSIGDRAVIGAGAVVTKDVPAGAVVAGNPARQIREIA
ncbi:MAG: N-acetyltransferase [Elusimicrobia bacterium]|nr:N-acetyltransferase [Elusimicrobiota bacterium]